MIRRALMLIVLGAISLSTCQGIAADIFESNRKLGRGVNLGNFLEAPRGADWGVNIEDAHIELIKQAGFDSLRLPVKWSDYAAQEPPYTIEPAFLLRVDHLLDLAETAGLNVVLNIHHYDGLDQDPVPHTERFVAIWQQLARRYKDRPDTLYFELDNEPHEQLNEVWNEVLLKGLAAVRATNPTRPVIVGPPFWNGIWALPKLKLPPDEHLIVTVHMYNPFEFTHQGASWVEPRIQAIKGREWGSAEEQAALQAELEQAAEWGQANKRPIFLGEFGAYAAAPMPSRVAWTRSVARHAEKLQMSWAYWEFGAGFGIYEIPSKRWRTALLEALIPKKPLE